MLMSRLAYSSQNAMLFLRKSLGISTFVGIALCQTQTDPPTIVDLGYAQYQGTFNATQNATTFLGIRYAAPPVG